MKTLIFFVLLANLLFTPQTQASGAKAAVSLEGETFNFELSGQKNWDYELKRVKSDGQTKVQLFVKALDRDFIDRLKNITNPFVKSISVKEKAIDKKWLIEFTLKNDQVETFDYLTDQPSRLIVDFYRSETPLLAVEEAAEAAPQKAAPQKKSPSVKKGNVEKRQPADVDILRIDDPAGIESSVLTRAGLYDGGDDQFSRFTMKESDYRDESVIKSRNNYYLRFPILESEFTFWKKMKQNPPAYSVDAQNNDENKQMRLLKTLFNKKRNLVFLQTLEWFKKRYPNSKYNDMLAYMAGDAYIELWRAEKNDAFYEQGQNAYREALGRYPESVLAERTSLLTGMLAIDKADHMNAIRRLQNHIQNEKYAQKISKQYAQIALAYSFSKVNKLDESLKLLNEVQNNTKDQLVLTEVAVRRGDFYFSTKKMNEAIAAYNLATEQFNLVPQLFPSAYFNKMEAQFWKSQFKDSHKSALDFAQNFPAHEFAPYALTRVGELLDIMGADQSKAVGAYLETHFRYGDSPKTIVARLHLLSAKMKSMKKEELDQTLIKMDELASRSDLPNVDQFKVAMVADGFARRKDYLQAIEILSKFYQQNPTRPDVKQVTQRIAKNIGDELKNLADQGRYLDLLKTYRQYSDTWLKTHSRIDADYFLGQAYENAGAYGAAISHYQKVATQLDALKNAPNEKEVRVNQYLPSYDSLNLRLAQNHYDHNEYQDSYRYLEKIQRPMEMSEPEQVQRVQLASALYEKKGDAGTSIRYLSDLSQLWSGEQKLSLPVQFRLAEMQVQGDRAEEAMATYERCREIIMADNQATEVDISRLAKSYADLLVSESKADEAAGLLEGLLKKHGGRYQLNHERYMLGDLYYGKGEVKKAESAWGQISEQDNLWKPLAQEKLRQAAWNVDYKKYLKRIPAMSQLEEESK